MACSSELERTLLDNGAAFDQEEGAEQENPLSRIPPWEEQVTVRGAVVSAVLGTLFSVIALKMLLTIGWNPNLNVAAGLLGFCAIKAWTAGLSRMGIRTRPFTPQENTVIQTTVVACSAICFTGGFAAQLVSLDSNSYAIIGSDYPGNRIEDVKDLSLGWIYGYLFLVSFTGIAVLVPLSQIMILKYNLVYPSGTATALLINNFHNSKGSDLAEKQLLSLARSSSFSFLWSLFKWFFSGVGGTCGFENFPIFGLKASRNSFYFDFNPSNVGAGMICSHSVNCSLMLGALASWGVLWPLINRQEGNWYPAGLASTDFKGLYGYKVFIAISLILGDGFYRLIKIVVQSANQIHQQRIKDSQDALPDDTLQCEDEVFLRGRVPGWLAGCSYLTLAAMSTAFLPRIFPAIKWYHILTSYLLAPAFAFCNSFTAGITDLDLASTYGKLAIFIFAAWAGREGGVVVGLVSCGIMFSTVSSASQLMKDFRTGYLTLSSPRAMLSGQVLGTALGCAVSPLCFWMYWTAFDVGNPDGPFKVPFAVMYRALGILGVEGLSAVPAHCLDLCLAVFSASILLCLLRDLAPASWSRFIPIPMAMAVPCYLGAFISVDMFLGSVVTFAWELLDREGKDAHSVAVASGLICGDGVWAMPSALLAMADIVPPICMTFVPSAT